MRHLSTISWCSAVLMAGLATGCVHLPNSVSGGRTYHVSAKGDDQNDGSKSKMLKTITAAARLAQPGDTITVHAGTYRERISPPRGGTSDTKRIVYQTAPGEQVEIKGSEIVKGWEKVGDDTWKVVVPNTLFGAFNPYADLIHGDWFDPRDRTHHTGAVYLNGDWLTEAATLGDILKPAGTTALWFGQVDEKNTTIWAQFKGVNPNEQLVEINVRQSVFYPEKTGINYLTVRGFALRQAATPWAPPTAEQIGLIGTHWSKGWIIESNTVSHSVCSGIALGKYGDQWDNTSADTAEGYVLTLQRALTNGWNKATVGSHVVRYNTISHCEQAGIVGSLGAIFSTISDNTIHDIHVRGLFSGAEMAGIKIHAAIDCDIRRNHVYRTVRALWLDWMAQGTRVTGNLFHDNRAEDLFVEVNHGPFLVDNNLFLSKTSLRDWSEGGAYAHNLFAGGISCRSEGRKTPFHTAHSTDVAGITNITGGDNRFFNNLFFGSGLKAYDEAKQPLQTSGNWYYGAAQPYAEEAGFDARPDFDPAPKLELEGAKATLSMKLDYAVWHPRTVPVTTAFLGTTMVSKLGYVNPDGTPLAVDRDFFGKPRDRKHPTAGPFENPGTGALVLPLR